MITTIIPWRKGNGSITARYTGSGNGTCTITSDKNEGEEREQIIHVTTGSIVREILIRQEAYSDEPIITMKLRSSEKFTLVSSDGLTINING